MEVFLKKFVLIIDIAKEFIFKIPWQIESFLII